MMPGPQSAARRLRSPGPKPTWTGLVMIKTVRPFVAQVAFAQLIWSLWWRSMPSETETSLTRLSHHTWFPHAGLSPVGHSSNVKRRDQADDSCIGLPNMVTCERPVCLLLI
jgi:hypothetical protein